MDMPSAISHDSQLIKDSVTRIARPYTSAFLIIRMLHNTPLVYRPDRTHPRTTGIHCPLPIA